MKIQLNLVLSLIVEAVKAETYIKGTVDRAAGGDQHASNAVAYHETAGDETVHERKIIRGIWTSSDKLRSYIQDYLDVDGASVADNNTLTVDEANDKIVLTLNVSERFNKANSDALARLCSKYIEDNTLVLWWGAINQQQMQYYNALLVEDMAGIQRLFNKRAPSIPETRYTTTLELSGEQLETYVGEHNTITYSIDDGVIDDIDIISLDPYIARGERDENYSICVHPRHSGYCEMKVFSRHNDRISKVLRVFVVEEE